MSDKRTLDAYASAADRYADQFSLEKYSEEESEMAALIAELPKGTRVLDLGCGPGHWAARMQKSGLTVDAVDASPEMAALAKSMFDMNVRVEAFEDLTLEGPYDGVWANFSLLHAPRSEFPTYLARLHAAMRPEGILHLGMKLGESEARDHLGRFYAYYGEQELCDFVEAAGFHVRRTLRGCGPGLAGKSEPFVLLNAHA